MIGSSIEFVFILSAIWFVSPLLVFSCALLLRFLVYYILCWWYLRNTKIEEDTSISAKDHLQFSTYQVVNQGLSFVQGNFDTVLVGSVFGLSILGPYNFASEISYLLFSKINPVFNKAIFPVLSKFQNQVIERQSIISESLLSHALICISLYLLMYFNIESLIPLAAKDPEGLILGFAKFILIMAMIRSVNNMVFNQLLSLGESKNLLKWNITVLIINYSFITIIYFSGASIQKFLFINIFLSLAVLIYILYKLRSFYANHLSFDKQIITYLIYFVSCGVFLYGIHLLELHLVLSVILGIMMILILSLGFYKQKLLSLIRFRIM
jgi:O-antigen/teichoic acid export membrane protein